MLNIPARRRVKNVRKPWIRRQRRPRIAGIEPLESRLMLDSTVVLNEVMYHPSGTDGGQQEWVELYNQLAVDVDLSGWRLSSGVDFEFPEGTRIAGGGYVVVATAVEPMKQATGVDALGPFQRRLSNAGNN